MTKLGLLATAAAILLVSAILGIATGLNIQTQGQIKRLENRVTVLEEKADKDTKCLDACVLYTSELSDCAYEDCNE